MGKTIVTVLMLLFGLGLLGYVWWLRETFAYHQHADESEDANDDPGDFQAAALMGTNPPVSQQSPRGVVLDFASARKTFKAVNQDSNSIDSDEQPEGEQALSKPLIMVRKNVEGGGSNGQEWH